MDPTVSYTAGTPEAREVYRKVQRAIRITERLNAIPYDDREGIREAQDGTSQPCPARSATLRPDGSLHRRGRRRMGWAEIGLGPRARSKTSERNGSRGSAGSVVVDPARAKQKLKAVRGQFFGRGVWICLLVIGGFIGMLVVDLETRLVAIAAPFAILAVAYTLVWLRRLAYWWRHSWSSGSNTHGEDGSARR